MHKKTIWKTPITLEEINQRNRNSLAAHIGIEFIEIGDDFLTAKMPIDHRTLQPMGILHGGASCVLAETVGSIAANYCVDLQTHICVGLDININHIRSARSGHVIGTAKPLHLGQSTQVWEIQIVDEASKRIAVSRLTIAVLTKIKHLS